MFRHILVSSFLVFSAAGTAAAVLQPYNIDKQNITISGVSSGAFMAVQMEIAYSATFSGAASIAGGIYWCAKGDSNRAQTVCMNGPERVNAQEHSSQARAWAAQGSIDPLSNLAGHNVFIYASSRDAIIKPLHSDKLAEFYAQLGISQVRRRGSDQAAHGFPTLDKGNACNLGFLPWLLKCNYDGAGEILKALHGSLPARGSYNPQHLHKFAQDEFNKDFFYPEGWVYVPEACGRGEKCGLHLALHGCQMNPDYIQDKFATLAGYNEWAETSNIIVLYPQSKKIQGPNPYGCWDWFGFTGADYAQKSGKQMAALKAMIDRLSGR